MSVLSIMEPFADEARRRPQQAAGNDDDAPAPGIFEGIGIQARVAQDETVDAQRGRIHEGYNEMAAALQELGVSRSEMVRAQPWYELPVPGGALDYDRLWELAQDHKLKLPVAVGSRAEYERWLVSRRGDRAGDRRALGKMTGVSGGTAQIAGSAISDMADSDLGPLQYMVGAGGGPITHAMAKEAGLNILIEAVKLPERVQGRAKLGEPMSVAEQVQDVAMAGGAAAALTGLGRGFGATVGKVAPPIQERTVAAIDRVAPGWRAAREAAGMDLREVTGADLAQVFADAVPRHARTPSEQAALNVVLREAEIDAASPFVMAHAGSAAHRARLNAAINGILEPEVRPIARGVTAMEGFMARVRGAESGGNDAAANPRSSAAGRYQFTDSTWLAMYKRRFGGAGLSDAQIVAKKANGDLQDMLMRDLTADNAAALRKAGVPVTEGNLYLAHFAGERGARKLHAADPEARVEDVLGGRVVEANPFLRGMTARDVIEWAAGKMGGRRAEFGGAAARAADDTARAPADADAPEVRFDDLDLPELRRDLFEDDAQWEAAQREIDYEVLGIEPLERAAPSPGVSMRPGEDTGASPTAGAMREIAPEPAPVNPAPVRAAESAAPDEASAAMIEVSGLIDDAEAAVRAMDPALAERIGQEAEQAFAALPPDLQAASRAWGVADGGAVQSPVRSFKGPEGRFLWNPQTGEARGAFPKGEGVTADDVRAFLAVPQEPALRDAATARFDDPAGVEADAQADFLAHDLRLLADEGALDGIAFMALRDGAEDSAASIFARLDADAAALEALRGCL